MEIHEENERKQIVEMNVENQDTEENKQVKEIGPWFLKEALEYIILELRAQFLQHNLLHLPSFF